VKMTEALSARIAIARVLYATDFSQQAARALPYALSIARKYGAILLPFHVVSPSPLPAGFPAQSWQAVVAQAIREAHSSLERLEPKWKNVQHKIRVCCGDAGTEISKIVRDEHIDLVVLGTHGRTGVRKALMGSVAEAVFRHAACPVLTVGPSVTSEPDNLAEPHAILYPTDLSAESRPALPFAVSLARENRARLYLLHVVQDGSDGDEEVLAAELRNMLPPEADLSCAPKLYVQTGNPAERIMQLAEELAVDLIVLSPKRHSGIPGTMATAYQVATQAICPVLTVRS
jgi:nucleotide-binding universal stress UspA family protein